MQTHLGPVSCADLAPFATPSELTVDEGEEIRSVEWLGWDFIVSRESPTLGSAPMRSYRLLFEIALLKLGLLSVIYKCAPSYVGGDI